ncbi:TonB-dependent receptor [Rhizobiaceae bacterium BDR2-2]|uniref:TonB-dependent receptor n=2 Tax=Ectorhizobium quercum TaxID=2965071 RepID=A0AAE3MYS3_9HYPH|nr:TonB-dependent receptor [Ectorhizobium quercum]MCX8995837.1 TonB-dependent receptor [Ectorhizobium quercum]
MNVKWNVGSSLLAIVVATAATATARAQDTSQDGEGSGNVTVLEPIVVTGSRIPQQISQTARTIYVVDAEEIQAEARSGKSLQQILAKTIPSFDPASEGARTSYGQNLRGRTALILIDGVSMNSARSLSRQFDSIDPFNIERVEVLSGATSIYGGNATGGVINIITRKGKDAQEGLHGEATGGMASGFSGSRDFDRNAAGAVTYNGEYWDARLSVAGTRSGAYYDGDGTMLIPDITQTSTAFNKRIDVMGSLGFQIDDSRRLELSGQYFDSEQDSPYGLYYGPYFAALANPDLFETRNGYESDFNPQTRRSMFNATYTDDDLLGQEFLLQGSFRREGIRFNPFPGTSPYFYFGGSSQDTDYYSVKAAFIAKPLDGLTITYGVDADRDSFTSKQNIFDMATAAQTGGLDFDTLGIVGLYPDIDVSTVAGFVQAAYEATDRLTINGGVRYQYIKTEVSDFVGAAQQIAILNGTATSADVIPGGEVSYDAALFNAGAAYKLTDTQEVYANFSQGFELPDPAKYYGIGNYALSGGVYSLLGSVNVGDSALEAIKTNSFEVGYRFNDGTYRFEAAGYYSTSDRSIDLNRTTLAVDVVDQERRVYGIEASGSVRLDHGFDVGASGHWVKTEVKADGGWENESIGTASVSKLGGHLGWTNDTLSLKFSGQHVFQLDDADGYEIDGYTLFDLTGSYTFENTDTTLRFGVLNLFDNDYTTVWGARAKALYGALADEAIFDYKGRGRTFAVSLTKVF